MLAAVKEGMGITSSTFDGRLTNLIAEVKRFMISAGVTAAKIDSSVGVVTRGVSDLFYNLNDYSPYFLSAVTQLKLESEVEKADV